MTNITKTGLAALAATSLLLSACGSDEQSKPRPAASGQPMAAEGKIVDISDGAPTTTSAEAPPLAIVNGVKDGTTAELLRLRRVGKVVTATVRLHADGVGEIWWPHLEGDDGESESAEGMRLVDEINGRQHFPLRDPDGGCLCSADIEGLYDEESADVYAKFAAPPEGVEAVSLHVPGFPSFDAVSLAP